MTSSLERPIHLGSIPRDTTNVMIDDTRSPAISVVVPLYNEEENVALLQSELTATLTGLDYEILFVDDGSRDQTVARIAPEPSAPARVLIRFRRNPGTSERGAPPVKRWPASYSIGNFV